MHWTRLLAPFAAALLLAAAPAPQDDKFEPEIAAFEAADAQARPAPGGVVFLGSSSIRMWDLATDFPDVRAVNRGFGGSHIAHSVRYLNRIVLPQRPATIVFYAGDNDLQDGRTPQAVLADFKALTKKVHASLPQTRVLFISIKPSVARWTLIASIREANALVRAYTTTDKRLGYVDIEPAMLGANGKPRPELFIADGLHLSRAGYDIWRDAVGAQLK